MTMPEQEWVECNDCGGSGRGDHWDGTCVSCDRGMRAVNVCPACDRVNCECEEET